MRIHVALLAAVLAAPVFAGEIYSWRDKDGKMHYSDVPPPAPTEPRKIGSIAAPAGTPAASERRGVADQNLEFKKRRAAASESEAKDQQKLAEAEESRVNCEQARNQLSALQSGERMVRFNAAGEREYIDDAQRAVEIERSRKAVDAWCK